jgi:hypothetical protein
MTWTPVGVYESLQEPACSVSFIDARVEVRGRARALNFTLPRCRARESLQQSVNSTTSAAQRSGQKQSRSYHFRCFIPCCFLLWPDCGASDMTAPRTWKGRRGWGRESRTCPSTTTRMRRRRAPGRATRRKRVQGEGLLRRHNPTVNVPRVLTMTGEE